MSHVPPDEAAAAQAGADSELPAGQPPPELSRQDFDGAAVDAVRVALPTWDVRPEELTSTVTSATPGELQAAVRKIAVQLAVSPTCPGTLDAVRLADRGHQGGVPIGDPLTAHPNATVDTSRPGPAHSQ